MGHVNVLFLPGSWNLNKPIFQNLDVPGGCPGGILLASTCGLHLISGILNHLRVIFSIQTESTEAQHMLKGN